MPSAVAASCPAAFEVLEEEPERIENLWKNRRYFKAALGAKPLIMTAMHTREQIDRALEILSRVARETGLLAN